MKSFAEQKVAGGKLVSIKIDYDQRINDIKILGDFFMHPEETVYKIEKVLVGTDINSSTEDITGKIEKVVNEEKAEMIGITSQAIAETIRMAIK